jgi:hypothetical protein
MIVVYHIPVKYKGLLAEESDLLAWALVLDARRRSLVFICQSAYTLQCLEGFGTTLTAKEVCVSSHLLGCFLVLQACMLCFYIFVHVLLAIAGWG